MPTPVTTRKGCSARTAERRGNNHQRPNNVAPSRSRSGSILANSICASLLKAHAIEISMDGKGAWHDNVFVERLWRSVKYAEVYRRAYDSVSPAHRSAGTSSSTTQGARTRALRNARLTSSIATCSECPSLHNPIAGNLLIGTGRTVQTNRATSVGARTYPSISSTPILAFRIPRP